MHMSPNCVSRVLLAGVSEWRLYELTAWVIMAKDIHVLIAAPGAPGQSSYERQER